MRERAQENFEHKLVANYNLTHVYYLNFRIYVSTRMQKFILDSIIFKSVLALKELNQRGNSPIHILGDLQYKGQISLFQFSARWAHNIGLYETCNMLFHHHTCTVWCAVWCTGHSQDFVMGGVLECDTGQGVSIRGAPFPCGFEVSRCKMVWPIFVPQL